MIAFNLFQANIEAAVPRILVDVSGVCEVLTTQLANQDCVPEL